MTELAVDSKCCQKGMFIYVKSGEELCKVTL